MANAYVGIDIGGSSIKCGMFINHALVKHWRLPLTKHPDLEKTMTALAKRVHQEIGSHTLKAMGVGIAGYVKDNHLQAAVNLNWFNVDLKHRLSQHFNDVNIIVKNDVYMALLGEKHLNKSLPENVVMLTIGTGVGGAFMMDGLIKEGGRGVAGEFGHMFISTRNILCSCGQQGCLETVVGARGLQNLQKIHQVSEQSPEMIFKQSQLADPISQEIVSEMIETLAKALNQIAMMVDPDCFIIGGGFAKAQEALFKPLVNYYQKHAFKPVQDIPITPATSLDLSGVYGAFEAVRHD